MSKRIIVTKPGISANEVNDARDLTFDSDLESLKYYKEGSVGVSGGAGTTVQEVTHGLGYIPVFAAYIGPLQEGGDTNDYSMVPFVFASGLDFFFGSCWADANKLYFQIVHDFGSTLSVTFYYKIFKNNTTL